MKRVTGIGGVFFKSDGPEKLDQWYENISASSVSLTGRAHRFTGAKPTTPPRKA